MLKTCFGCCSLRHGVSGIAIINIIWNILEIMKHSFHRYESYNRVYWKPVLKNNDTINIADNTTEGDVDYWSEIEDIPIMSGIFMDYLFIVTIGWIVLEFISNFFLKQSTFKHSTHKIYVWLVVYYGNILFMIFHVIHYIISLIRYTQIKQILFTIENQLFGHLIAKLVYIVIIIVEIFVIHSYYIVEKNALLNDFIQLKWKYVSKGNVVSRGVDFPSAATFNAETSCQTVDGSRIPPYITNILQN